MVEQRWPAPSLVDRMKATVSRSFERDRRVERYFEAFARAVWPWNEQRLLILVGVLVFIDYATTHAVLVYSGKNFLGEGGLLAAWALDRGGLPMVFLVDIGALIALTLAATVIRQVYLSLGFQGFARSAYIALLLPYAVVAFAAIINNILLAVL
ncbi:MAG: hypothetical protein IBX68_08240 [Dehalococcoidia bacterium]|nr:hypothetical protein [Dehalococcoidia bacterium]